MQRVAYQNIDSKWSTTVVALVATASLAVGVIGGVALAPAPAQAALYAPVATATQPAVATSAAVPQMRSVRYASEAQYAPEAWNVAEDYEIADPVMYQAAPQSQSWIVGMAGAVSLAVGALVYKIKSAEKKIPALGAAAYFAAEPAFANTEPVQQTNGMAPIAVALFIILPVFFLITLFVSSNANPGNASGSFSQDYYDKSKQAGKKLTNEAARLRGDGIGMYAQKRDQ